MTRPIDSLFPTEVAELRRVFSRALGLALLAGCGGAVAATEYDDHRDPTPDAGADAAIDAPKDIAHPTPSCRELNPWGFECDPTADAGPRDPGDSPTEPPTLPKCGDFTTRQDNDVCAAYCYGPNAHGVCDRRPTDRDNEYLSCQLGLGQTGAVRTVTCWINLPGGRRHASYTPLLAEHRSEVGQWLARLAHLEAASVDAFRILRDDLRDHGAPDHLIEAAERSMADEKRHARIIGQFAEAKGETVKDHPPAQRAARSLADIARENAVEGCVRESYGALVAMWQARSAADPELREAMVHIAEDESRHAALAWHVAAWAESRLTAEENARIAEAKHEAERDLAAEIATMEETDATRWLGIPSARDGAHLHAALADYRAQA